jgi:hypothetical protein
LYVVEKTLIQQFKWCAFKSLALPLVVNDQKIGRAQGGCNPNSPDAAE